MEGMVVAVGLGRSRVGCGGGLWTAYDGILSGTVCDARWHLMDSMRDKSMRTSDNMTRRGSLNGECSCFYSLLCLHPETPPHVWRLCGDMYRV